jgi:hypothetical protein
MLTMNSIGVPQPERQHATGYPQNAITGVMRNDKLSDSFWGGKAFQHGPSSPRRSERAPDFILGGIFQ